MHRKHLSAEKSNSYSRKHASSVQIIYNVACLFITWHV